MGACKHDLAVVGAQLCLETLSFNFTFVQCSGVEGGIYDWMLYTKICTQWQYMTF